MRKIKGLLATVCVAMSIVLFSGCLNFGASSLSFDFDGFSLHLSDKARTIVDAGYTIEGVTDSYPTLDGQTYTTDSAWISKGGSKTSATIGFANFSTNSQPAIDCSVYRISLYIAGDDEADVKINGVAVNGMGVDDAVSTFTSWGFKFDEERIADVKNGDSYFLRSKSGDYSIELNFSQSSGNIESLIYEKDL